MIGIGKVDAAGIPIPLDQDARPIVMGLTWRKIAFKCTLAMDKPRIQERLVPSQLAVGILCGRTFCYHDKVAVTVTQMVVTMIADGSYNDCKSY